ncbi:MAG: hypothetical protein M3O71_23265 [Bacteroidota bacterium]|nr:hypothetical protein [Bacteroidota bacterium]
MKKFILSLSLAGLVTGVFAQQDPIAMKYAPIISADLAKKHLSIIASDALEGRETGKPGADKAAHYIADEFKSLGLQPIVNGSYFFDVPLSENSLNVSFSVNGTASTNGDDFFAYKPATDRTLDVSEIVFVGYGTDTEIAGTDLTGKIVLWINEDKPEAGKTPNTSFRATPARALILKNLQSKSPAIILAASGEMADLLKKNKGYITAARLGIKKDASTEVDKTPGVFWITTGLADQLVKSSGKTYDALKAAGANAQTIKADVKLSYKTITKDVKAVDVLGYLPGSDPKLKDEVVVI